jgi:hypothetical protein
MLRIVHGLQKPQRISPYIFDTSEWLALANEQDWLDGDGRTG